MTTSPKKYSPEVRERAVRMVFEHRGEHESQWAAIESIAAKIGCTCSTRWSRRCTRVGRSVRTDAGGWRVDPAVNRTWSVGSIFEFGPSA